MEAFGLSFHHFGLATRRPDRAANFLTQLGYEVGKTVFDPEQNANLIWCESKTMPPIEIIYPAESDGPLDGILRNRSEMIYHLCYEADSAEQATQAMRDQGLRPAVVSPPKPAVLFGGRTVSFYQIAGFGLIEVLERGGA